MTKKCICDECGVEWEPDMMGYADSAELHDWVYHGKLKTAKVIQNEVR